MSAAAEIARLLVDHIDQLVPLLLPGGHLERNRDWRCGSVAGEAGTSLIVSLAGKNRGHWRDFATGDGGDLLDLVAATQDLDIGEAIAWARHWLGLDAEKIADGAIFLRPPPIISDTAIIGGGLDPPATWPKIWDAAVPIAGTLADTYLAGRGLAFADQYGDVLRFAARRARRSAADVLEYHPAMLSLLRNVVSGEPCGIVNVYLMPDGRDRIRDRKGKTVTGKAGGAAVMLGEFEDVTYGLTICEGPETAIAINMSGQSPVWALCGAGNMAAFPVLDIQSLTVAADTGAVGQNAAREVAARWRAAGREVRSITPPIDDWADEARRTAI